MNTPQRSSIGKLNGDQPSSVSQPGYRQAEFPYQIPKIDHAFIIENYRRLRIQQRDQLARLRIPDQLKRRIFNFPQDQDTSYEKPELVIFNHPFRGKTVMTRQEVEKQLERQRKNAQFGQEKQSKGQKIQQNVLNEMGLEQEHITLQKAKMTKQKPSSQEFQEYQKKPKQAYHQQKEIAQEINEEQQKKMQGDIYYISKERKHQEGQRQRTQKMKKLIRQKEDSNEKSQTGRSKQRASQKDNKINDFKDMPIIGQQPVVVRDIKFDQKEDQKMKNNLKTKSSSKGFYRPFGNEHEIRSVSNQGMTKEQDDQHLGSGQAFIRKRKQSNDSGNQENREKSLSEISAIQSKEIEEEDLSNSQSLNNALFLQ